MPAVTLAQAPLSRWPALAWIALPAALLVWSYWTTLGDLAEVWATKPEHSHGYLVPVFAAVLLWLRRDHLQGCRAVPVRWGFALVALAIVMRLFGTYAYRLWFDQISLVPCLAGLVLLLGGRPAWRWAGPSIAFLAFMVPLPYSAAILLTDPLQRVATLTSTFSLQTLGLPAVAEGNIILINDVRLGVVEACSGLRMLVIFFALSVAVALTMRRPMWERIAVVLSAVPIALATNVLRITATGVLHETAGPELADAVFHDLAGWLMMPIALLLLSVEQQILKRLLLESASSPAATPRVTFARMLAPAVRSSRATRLAPRDPGPATMSEAATSSNPA
jgi:exosortase